MPVDKAAEIGIVDAAAANAKSMLFLVSGHQGHKDKPSVFRIKRGSAKRIKQRELVAQFHYAPSNPADGEKEYWVWELDLPGTTT